MSTYVDPKAVWAANVFPVKTAYGDILCRRRDLTAMVMEGGLPMPMVAAVDKLIKQPELTAQQRVMELLKENEQAGKQLLQTMREHVCEVAIQPKVTFRTDDPEQLCVLLLDVEDLSRIFSETSIRAKVSAEQAAEFRVPAPEHDVAPAPVGASVQATAEHVAPVEYIGR